MWLEGRDIAVVGAGIGGLAAAIALAQRRARVRVFEQAAALGAVGGGIQIAPNGVAVLEAMGLRDAAEARASLPQAVELVDHRGRQVARVPLGQTIVARHGRPYWHFHRADLLAVLAAGAAEAGVGLSLGAAVTAVEPDGDGLRLAAAGGAAARRGGGGGRRPVGPPGRAPRRPPGALHRARGLAGAGARRPGAARAVAPVARVTMGPGRHLVTYPLRGASVVNVVAVERREAWAEEGWSTRDDPANLRRAFAGWDGAAGALIAAIEECLVWGLFDHAPLAAWVDGRLALLGDACHPMLPFLAQGATMALEDAWVLAELPRFRRGSGTRAFGLRGGTAAAGDAGAAGGGGRGTHLSSPSGAARAGACGARPRLGPGAVAARAAVRLALRARRHDDGLTGQSACPTSSHACGRRRHPRMFEPGFLTAFMQVIMIDLVLAGDNAVVIGLAAAGLPPELRRKAIIIGIVAATLMRIGFALIATQLLGITGLLFGGGLLLLWVCWKMYEELRVSRTATRPRRSRRWPTATSTPTARSAAGRRRARPCGRR